MFLPKMIKVSPYTRLWWSISNSNVFRFQKCGVVSFTIAICYSRFCSLLTLIIIIVAIMQRAWIDSRTRGGASASHWQRATVQPAHKDTERQSMFCHFFIMHPTIWMKQCCNPSIICMSAACLSYLLDGRMHSLCFRCMWYFVYIFRHIYYLFFDTVV